jgi:hypothetical protein
MAKLKAGVQVLEKNIDKIKIYSADRLIMTTKITDTGDTDMLAVYEPQRQPGTLPVLLTYSILL